MTDRFVRLAPLYFFTLIFFWRLMVLLGGDGPMFFGYDHISKCSSTWVWHVSFLNNIIPWKDLDGCANWTWFVACDL